ncbi:PGA11 Predicted GPI-anchored protein 11 [Candida maltosa Xu316]|uniref:Uncharacterized protein n=1 Tax=Candida maltosa (strain Xu316) TaxID=1245528 RepID=M3JAR2_CANMX|nr:hypothetical protein G210_0076 [Candida maltosa Xu316]
MKFSTVSVLALAATMVAATPVAEQAAVQVPIVGATKSKRDGSTGAELRENGASQETAGLFGNGNAYGNSGIGGFIDATIDSITKLISSPIRGILAPQSS